MEETEISHFLHILVRMGEALQNSGAEVFRVEDTLNRIAIAYGAEDVNVFVDHIQHRGHAYHALAAAADRDPPPASRCQQ